MKGTERMGRSRSRNLILIASCAVVMYAAPARAQQQAATPETSLSEALSAACRQDPAAFANYLTSDNAAAFRALPGPQRTALMKRFVLLEDPGRALFSSGVAGHPVIVCDAPGISTEMRFGETRLRENLAFIPMEIPLPGQASRSIVFALVRENGGWKLISVGLLLLDIPAMAKQWEQADLQAHEDNAIAGLRKLATALETYRTAYGNLPETLAPLGPAPKGGISPETAGLVDGELAAGRKDGYSFRYSITPSQGSRSEDDANKNAGFTLAASPDEYGKMGRRSFFLDSTGVLRGADKNGAVATSTDERIGSL